MISDDISPDPGRHQRLLEGWLPLAQEASARYGWGLDAPALQALILAAAPALSDARSAFEATAILWATYARTHHEVQHPCPG
jgi:hypothetical protein